MKFENVEFDNHFYKMLKDNHCEPAGAKDRPIDLDPRPDMENPYAQSLKEPLPLALIVLQTLATQDRKPIDGPSLFIWANQMDI